MSAARGPRIHVLGVCGTFMAGLAQLGRELGYRVEGSDAAAYPPMSDQLAAAGIEVRIPYAARYLEPAPDQVVVGNALTRGNPAVEHLLEHGLAMTSGPAWLAEHVLAGREVLAVAGTHGKTTTSSMLAWILERADLAPGFLIGGVPRDFGVSARLGAGKHFVVEADEYDSAFFDKRSKFVHYRPRVLVINNIEFDHADIFDSLADIRRQFHHVVRTVPGGGLIVAAAGDGEVDAVLQMGCWTPVTRFGEDAGDWRIELLEADGSRFRLLRGAHPAGEVSWGMLGRHNCLNAAAAVAAAAHAGVEPGFACAALERFGGVKRRLELRGEVGGVTVYDDFAHHPTAIRGTLAALRARVGTARILAVVDPASNTMRSRVHEDAVGPALADADAVWIRDPGSLAWDLERVSRDVGAPLCVERDVAKLVRDCADRAQPGDHVVIMSNGGFDGGHAKLLERLRERAPERDPPAC